VTQLSSSLPTPQPALGLFGQPLFVQSTLTALTLLGLLLAVIAKLFAIGWLEWLGYSINFAAGGIPAAREAVGTLFRERKLDVDLLMVVAALGAASVGAPEDGAILLFLFSLSNTLQDWAMNRTSNAIHALMQLNPSTATIKVPTGEKLVKLEDITIGDILVVRPGERFATDGLVLAGTSVVDESAISGESLPIEKNPGDVVRSGTLNDFGSLEVQSTATAGESTLAKLIGLVENAQAAKSPTEQFAERLEGPYTIVVLCSVFVVYGLAHFVFGLETGMAWYRAMSFLVAASPCAVVIATPAAVLSAMAAGARHGVLFKSGAALEAMSRTQILAFDKTGTVTEGKMRLVQTRTFYGNEELNLELAASLESHSEHPVAKTIVAAAPNKKLLLSTPQAIKGQGMVAELSEPDAHRFGASQIWIGNRQLAQTHGVSLALLEMPLEEFEQLGYTTMILGAGGVAFAIYAVADTPRSNAKNAIAQLKKAGLHLAMLTGDRQVVAERVAKELGIDEIMGQLRPEQKLEVIGKLQHQGKVAMVGDGINDAPALVAADLGIAMGSGSDVALESADVVLMKNNLEKLAGAFQLAKAAQNTVKFNLYFALSIIAVAGTLSVFGVVPLPLAVIAHEGGTVFVCLMGLRLLGHPVGSTT
jgi:Zn2+/Cd2+-exporting ATPase